MTRKIKRLILLLVVLLIAFGCYWFFFLLNNPAGGGAGAINSLKSLFPYGLNSNSTIGTNIVTTNPNGTTSTSTSPTMSAYDSLVQISQRPVIGMTIAAVVPYLPPVIMTGSTTNLISTSTATAAYRSTIFDETKLPVVRFAEHGTGYIYDVDVRGQYETKQTGTTIVRVAQAYFGDGGDSVIFRYLKNDNETIETYLGKIIPPADTTSGQFATVSGSFLPENISDLVMAPDGKSFAYLLPTPDGVSGVSLNTDGTNKTQLFSSSFDEWLLDWKNGGMTATTKAASTVPGFSYLIQDAGAFQKIIGGIDGLTTNLSPDGNSLLYDSSDGNQINTFIRHSNGDSTKLTISTLPEKCVWGASSNVIYCAVPTFIPVSATYPDDWYQGTVHFQDQIWRVNVNSGVAIMISDLESKNIDVVDPMLDPQENFLIFKNNNDDTPWSLDLRQNVSSSATTVPISSPFPALNINQ